jgi:hypothetical protein
LNFQIDLPARALSYLLTTSRVLISARRMSPCPQRCQNIGRRRKFPEWPIADDQQSAAHTFATFSAVSLPTNCATFASPTAHTSTHVARANTHVFDRALADASTHQKSKIRLFFRGFSNVGEQTRTTGLAEGVGFEPTLRFPVNTLSKRAPSATRPSLHVTPCRPTNQEAMHQRQK